MSKNSFPLERRVKKRRKMSECDEQREEKWK